MPGSTQAFVAVGRRTALRPLTLDDVGEHYLAWMRDGEVLRYLEARFAIHTLESLRAYVREMSARDDVALLAIVALEGGRHIGNLKIGPISAQHGTADVGLIVGERTAWGAGHGTEAIRLATEFAFRELPVRKLTAGCYAANLGSAIAFRRAGWEADGTRRAHFVSDEGAVQDALHFAAFRG